MLGLWLVLGLMIAVWVFHPPRGTGVLVVGAVWLGILAVHFWAPDSGFADTLGGTARGWAGGGAAALMVVGYRAIFHLMQKAAEREQNREAASSVTPPTPAQTTASGAAPGNDAAPVADAEIDRYARHLVLREIGGPGQMRLRASSVLIVGAGGLGAPVCLYLAAAGVGRITVADDDVVSLSNLQRQVIFRSDQQGHPKAQAATAAMAALNPHVSLTALDRRITDADTDLIADFDLVIDGTDSFAARAAINRACVAAGVPLIAGAIAQWEGQVTLYDPARGGPCMACLFPEAPAPGLAPPCAEAGVVGPLPGVVGSLMALEAIKLMTGAGQGLREQLLIFDGLYGENRTIRTAARHDCPVCGNPVA